MLSREILADLKRQSMRKKIWFKVLSRLERAQIDVTMKVVEWVRSPILDAVLNRIISKLRSALQNRISLQIKLVGLPATLKLSRLAQSWGNVCAKKWVADLKFARFLAILDLNSMYPSAGPE